MIPRRDFVKQFGAVSALGLAVQTVTASGASVVILLDEADPKILSQPVKWAIGELKRAVEDKKVPVRVTGSPNDATDAILCIIVASQNSDLAHGFPPIQTVPEKRESFFLQPGKRSNKPALWVGGTDVRGFVYGILELADRVAHGGDPLTSLVLSRMVQAGPANEVRSITRAFVSDVEDKTWYYDKNFWQSYLSTLAANRFNRFSLTFGLGYDFPRGVTGDYFHFLYPYLFDVPGYKVHVAPLADSERDRNLEMLKFITDETALRGLDFQIGIWTHAYQWVDSPHAQHHVEGLSAETHAPYCRDALALLLKTCPAIQGVTLRVHGESGIPEGSYSFWQTLFEGITTSGRKIEIDMHAKGLDQTMIDIALKTRMPIKVSPKFWAEHMGLAYHQAAIREVEMPRTGAENEGVFKLSNGSRRFLRYGYGDLYRHDRNYDILYRIWPGTQRTLLWGDSAIASGYGHASHFCGASGVEICEPLFFKGRQGSGLPGGRCSYADESLKPKDGDWSKYRYTYRVWGRLLYNPDADGDEWKRYLRSEFGPEAAVPMEQAVSSASRVLPLLTTAHLPSASNNSYWPEMYTNMPIVPGSAPEPYSDTPEPKRFGTTSPLDPELFSTVAEHAGELLDGKQSGKYSPIEVAHWLEGFADAAGLGLSHARGTARLRTEPNFRRFEEDINIQMGIAQFFAAKLRSAVLYEIYMSTKNPSSLQNAIVAYKKARAAWASMAERAHGVYAADITYGPQPIKRGHWIDRLPAIDKDLTAMEALRAEAPDSHAADEDRIKRAITRCTGQPERLSVRCSHKAPAGFRPGEGLPISISLAADRERLTTVRLRYRHVNQAERWQAVDLERNREAYGAAIPGSYTNSPYPLQYYFEFRNSSDMACLYPGLNATLSNQPYFVISRT
jgi:hypothetical protein